MSLPHAILGLLNYQAMTGYDLKHRWFDVSMRYFWPADQAQIYRTLDNLVTQGWATFTIEPGGDRPNRKVYSLTESGRQELQQWLTTPLPLPPVRDPLMVQLFSAADIPDAEIADLLAKSRAAHTERLAAYAQVRARLEQLEPDKRRRLWLTVVGTGIATETAAIAWLDQVIAGFRGPEPAGSVIEPSHPTG